MATALSHKNKMYLTTAGVLVFGIEKMPKGIIRSSFFEPWREQAGLAATPAYFALRSGVPADARTEEVTDIDLVVLFEHPEWQKPLFAALERRGAGVVARAHRELREVARVRGGAGRDREGQARVRGREPGLHAARQHAGAEPGRAVEEVERERLGRARGFPRPADVVFESSFYQHILLTGRGVAESRSHEIPVSPRFSVSAVRRI